MNFMSQILCFFLSAFAHGQNAYIKESGDLNLPKDKKGYYVIYDGKKINDWFHQISKDQSLGGSQNFNSGKWIGSPLDNSATEGPGFSGGGNLLMATQLDAFKSVLKMKELLKNPHAYRLVSNANRAFYDGNGISLINTLLITFLNPTNKLERVRDPQYGTLLYNEFNDPIKNEVAKEIDKYTLKFRSDDCPSDNQKHAVASVLSETEICFSLGGLSKLSLSALDQEVLGFWVHELAHLRGYDEPQADIIQDLFTEGHNDLFPNYYNSVSQIFRRDKLPIKELNYDFYLEWIKPDFDKSPFYKKEEYILAKSYFDEPTISKISEIMSHVRSQSQFIEDYPATKVCEDTQDISSDKMQERYKDLLTLSDATIRQSNMNHMMTNKEMDFRVYLMMREISRNDALFCTVQSVQLCKSPIDTYRFISQQVQTIRDSYLNFIYSIWNYQNLRRSAFPETYADYAGVFRTDDHMPRIFDHMVEAHISINRMRIQFDSVIKLLETPSICDSELIPVYDPPAEQLKVIKENVLNSIVSPLQRYFSPGQIKSMQSIWSKTKNDSYSDINSAYKNVEDYTHTDAFVDALTQSWPAEQENYRSVFIILDSLKLEDPYQVVTDKYEACKYSRDEEEYYECIHLWEENQ